LRSLSQNFDKKSFKPARDCGAIRGSGKGFYFGYTAYWKGFLLVREKEMKIILWIIAIIFIVGLLTLTGVFKLIF